ncbi:hypothetical protein HIG13_004880 [Escherichia coli]|nr:hypothetical protein [Escherichia coli]EFH2192540.1 hypothetical protein [Escherichia coli]EFI3581238.1 hypothetical protein [Escherichia coli]EFI3765192.1 hypothetical protein [Escherichia coli]EFI3854044.1 hypothetical protein [Escherichia coli]
MQRPEIYRSQKSKKPRFSARPYEFGAGLGIENFFYHIDINIICLV